MDEWPPNKKSGGRRSRRRGKRDKDPYLLQIQKEQGDSGTLLPLYNTMPKKGDDATETTSLLSGGTTRGLLNLGGDDGGERQSSSSSSCCCCCDALGDELNEANEGDCKNYFLDANLIRSAAILPSHVANAAAVLSEGHCYPIARACKALWSAHTVSSGEEEKTDEMTMEEAAAKATTTTSAHIVDYILVPLALLSLSAMGPLLLMQEGDPIRKVVWRESATALLLLPLALASMCYQGLPSLSLTQGCCIILAGIFYAAFGILFSISLHYNSFYSPLSSAAAASSTMTVGNAIIFNNSQVMILFLGKLFDGKRPSLLVASGTLLAMAGIIMCSWDENFSLENDDEGVLIDSWTSSLLRVGGNLIGVAGALCGVFYLVLAKNIRSRVPAFQLMFGTMLIGSILSIALVLALDNGQVTIFPTPSFSLDRDIDSGLFAWTQPRMDRLPLTILLVIVCNFFGAVGYIRVMYSFDPLVTAVGNLLEPVVAMLLQFGSSHAYGVVTSMLPSWVARATVTINTVTLPTWKGWVGNALVFVGALITVYQPVDPKISVTIL